EQFREAALSYAAFQKYLSDIDINTIKDTITDFHNTVKRLEKFRLAVDGDSARRAAKCSELISFVNERAAYSDIIVARLEKGELPYRVTHNDTKINNVLFDEKTDKGLCVIDLDTIMRGSMLYDFGDAIRYGCNTAKEDEKDLDKIVFDKEKYEAYESAYIEVLGNTMTAKERELLRIAPLIMTYELVIRFLTDYLEGDVYFKTHYADHNYYRARCQAKLLSEMEKWRDNKVGIL
ncbi:MAG: aminoglycoside phosphotransferase family protein, partial [Clostridia bacterium]|nr:aminoglycoside phosphotransferase family protein [Clostridia bacterium]